MKKVFIIAAFAGLMSCNDEPKPIIVGTQFDFTQDEGVSDSLVYGEYEPDQVDAHPTDPCGHLEIDSLQNVNELLDYLETIPSTHR